MPTVRPARAVEGETVEIRWTLRDGTIYYQRVTCPPKATREHWAGAWHQDTHIVSAEAQDCVRQDDLRTWRIELSCGCVHFADRRVSSEPMAGDALECLRHFQARQKTRHAKDIPRGALSDGGRGLAYANEACATCGIPRDLHRGPTDPPVETPNSTWGDLNRCRKFVRCDPPRPAYGEAWWVR